MKRNSTPPDDSWESDAVWKLLDQAPPMMANTRFVDEAVRAARLAPQAETWWARWLGPAPLTGWATAAALTFAVVCWLGSSRVPVSRAVILNSPQAVVIQDIAETETLLAAVDHLDNFSDNDLVGLIGL